jgi:hypothetical protein
MLIIIAVHFHCSLIRAIFNSPFILLSKKFTICYFFAFLSNIQSQSIFLPNYTLINETPSTLTILELLSIVANQIFPLLYF